MRKVAFTVLLLVIAVSAQSTQPVQSSGASPTPAQQFETAKNAKVLFNEAAAEFRKGDCRRVLQILSEVIGMEPNNIVAHNMAGNCSMYLGDYPSAAESFRRALEIQPDESHNLSGLTHTYSLAGMTAERDAIVERIRALVREGRMPNDFGYVSDSFQVGDLKVLVTHFPKLTGRFGYRYHFDASNQAGKQTYRVALESNDVDQSLWATEHPDAAAAGKRVFSLDGYGPNSHTTYRFYDGEPSYEQVRDEVKKILAGKASAISQSTYQTAPSRKADSNDSANKTGSSGK